MCSILPEHRSATKRAALQPSLIEDHLPGETTSPFFVDYAGNDWLWNHGWVFLLLGAMILRAVSSSLSVRH